MLFNFNCAEKQVVKITMMLKTKYFIPVSLRTPSSVKIDKTLPTSTEHHSTSANPII